MKNYKVLVCEPVHPAALEKIKQFADILPSYDQLAEADAIVNRNLSLTREELQKAKNLKVIGIHGTGTDGVDLEAAFEQSIQVFNVPSQNAESVAELIVCQILMLARKIHPIQKKLMTGAPLSNTPAEFYGMELRGKTFGMLGVGEIAKRTCQILTEGFGMKAAGYSRSLTPELAEKYGITYCASTEELLRQSDVVSVGLALCKETEGWVGRLEFDQMKRSALFINTARGKLVDEKALYAALRDGKIAGAACDVFESEPPTELNPLLSLPNFIATPHIGAHTEEALYRVGMAVAEGIEARLVH